MTNKFPFDKLTICLKVDENHDILMGNYSLFKIDFQIYVHTHTILYTVWEENQKYYCTYQLENIP